MLQKMKWELAEFKEVAQDTITNNWWSCRVENFIIIFLYKVVHWPTKEESFHHEPNAKGKRETCQL